MEAQSFAVTLNLEDGYRFAADFLQDDVADLVLDEPAPLGEGSGPNAARVLAVAVGNCLAASLLFCLKRARIEVQELRVDVGGAMERNERGRLRITDLDVKLHPVVAAGDVARMQRCMDVFEDFCVVTQSVRDGLQVNVEVDPATSAVPA